MSESNGPTSGTQTDGPGRPPRTPGARPPLKERVQARVAAATREHRINAAVKSKAPAKPSRRGTRAVDAKPTRRARLRVTRIDPWSVMKTSFLLAIAFGVVTVVAVAMVWSVLDAAGVWDSINKTIQESVGGPDTADLNVENYVGTSRVLGFTTVVAAVDVILITAIATLGAFLYNMSAALLGGVEVTLAEDQH